MDSPNTLVSREEVGPRTARGAYLAALRLLGVYGLGAVASIVLTRYLTPADFGSYAIIAALSSMTALIASGLGVALTAQRGATDEDLNAIFWLILGVSSLLGGGLAGTALFGPFSEDIRFLLLTLGASLPLIALRFPSELQLYRSIRLDRASLIELSEVVGYQTLSVSLVVAGLGIRSFGVALLSGAAIAVVLAQALHPWRPARPRFRPAVPWLKQAAPYQAQILLNVARDRLTLPVLALVAGTAVTGWFGWAYSAAAVPLAFAVLAGQSLLPGLANLREEAETMVNVIRFSTRLLALLLMGLGAMLAGAIHPIITVVFSPLWLPAINSFWLLLLASVVLGVVAPLIQLAQVDGRASQVARWQLWHLAVVWSGLFLAAFTGAGGLALAYAAAAFLQAMLAYRSSTRLYALGWMRDLLPIVASGILSGLAGYWVSKSLAHSQPLALVASLSTSFSSYVMLLLILAWRQTVGDLSEAWRLAHKPRSGASLTEGISA